MEKQAVTNEIAIVSKKKISSALTLVDAAWMSLSPQTQSAYQSDLNQFLDFIKKDIKQVNASDVSNYINDMKTVRKLRNKTINRKIASLSKLFSVYKKAGMIRENPVSVLKDVQKISFKTSKEVHQSLSLKEIKMVTKYKKSDNIFHKRIAIIVKTLASNGLRISEMINILKTDIEKYSEKNMRIRIVGKGQKERFIFMSIELYNEILSLFPEENKYLFYTIRGTPYDRRVVWKTMKDVFTQKANRPDIHPHMLRHFYATYKISVEKKDIKAVSLALGHSDVSITINSYCDTSLDENEAAVHGL